MYGSMLAPCLHPDEPSRLRALWGLELLDTAPEERFDRILRLARALFGTSIGALSLVDRDRQFFKSSFGLDARETPRDISFCGHAILGGTEPFIVPDAWNDERFWDNPLVKAAPFVRFYAGATVFAEGYPVGTICVIDPVPRSFTDRDVEILNDLRRLVEEQFAIKPILELTRQLAFESSERQRQEEALRSEHARLSALLQSLHSAIVVEREDRTVVLANRKFGHLFEPPRDPETLVGADGRALAEQIAARTQDRASFLERVEGLVSEGSPAQGDEFTIADHRTFERDYVPVRVDEDHREHLWHYRDITGHKTIQTALETARVQALEAARVKADFLATMSHEIRTPMNGVIGTLSLVDEARLDPETRELLQTASRSATGLMILLNDILDFSRLEAGKLQVESVPVHVATILEDVARLYEPAARAKGLALTVEPVDPTLHLVADENRLRQILNNLVGNAVKFTNQGEVRVRAHRQPATRTENVTPIGAAERPDDVVLAIEDTGMGIPADKQEYIFDKFAQADASTARVHGGSGLGLAICRQLTRLLGGEIGVKSCVGVGSTFFVRFPYVEHTLQRTAPIADDTVPTETFAGLRILVVEDNVVNRTVAVGFLRALGCRAIDTACDGREALVRVSATEYDLIFMDCHMPEMDGFETTVAIRKRPETAKTPIVALTASAFAEDKDRCLASGMNSVLTKPLDRRSLSRTLTELTRGASQRARAVAPERQSEPAANLRPDDVPAKGPSRAIAS